MKNFKWTAAALAFFLTLALSVGLISLRQKQMVKEPLLKRLNELQSVQAVNIQQEDGKYVIVVKLKNVKDFPSAYRKLQQEIENFLPEDKYHLDLLDQRNQLLANAYQAVQIALYEGEQRGNFTEMAQYIARTLSEYKITEHHFTVDEENIYLKLQHDDAYLYATIKRQRWQKEGERT
ncbi:MAG: hypothetical protein GX893_02050 [Firmicutes bacterium]|nr:hypothetical protein [Bacillota bacterium]